MAVRSGARSTGFDRCPDGSGHYAATIRRRSLIRSGGKSNGGPKAAAEESRD
jgi:hypothetical protein